MKLVKLPNNVIVNLDNLNRADFSRFEGYSPSLTLNFVGDTPETNVNYVGDDAERVWEYLCEQSYVLV